MGGVARREAARGGPGQTREVRHKTLQAGRADACRRCSIACRRRRQPRSITRLSPRSKKRVSDGDRPCRRMRSETGRCVLCPQFRQLVLAPEKSFFGRNLSIVRRFGIAKESTMSRDRKRRKI